jgi:hypothetical protein
MLRRSEFNIWCSILFHAANLIKKRGRETLYDGKIGQQDSLIMVMRWVKEMSSRSV